MVAAAVIGAGLGGALISSSASRHAANTQANAANNSNATTLDMFNRMRTDLSPYMSAGTTSLAGLNTFMGINPDGTMNPNAPGVKPFTPADLPSDPGYQFRMQQGQDAIMNQRSAMGGVLSGATLKDLTKFAQGTASDEFNQAWQRYMTGNATTFDRLFDITGMGENAAAGVGTAGLNTAGTISSNNAAAANANAAGTVGTANAITGSIGNMYQQWIMGQILAGNPLPGTGPG